MAFGEEELTPAAVFGALTLGLLVQEAAEWLGHLGISYHLPALPTSALGFPAKTQAPGQQQWQLWDASGKASLQAGGVFMLLSKADI